MKVQQKVIWLIITTIITLGVSLTLFLHLDWSITFYIVFAAIIINVATFSGLYIQRTSKPHCKNCGHELKMVDKQLLNQYEEIVRGRFIFIYKFAYEFNCPSCNEVVHINKTVKK